MGVTFLPKFHIRILNRIMKSERIVNLELAKAGLLGVCICFIDNVLVHSNTEEEHIKHVAATLAMLR
jgi:hypothetical protein